jgi:lipocalin
VNQCDDVFKRVSLEGIDIKRREDIDANRYSGASSEKAKINMLLKLALVQQESTYIKIENASKSDELDAMKAAAERARNKECSALRAAADQKKNDEFLASYINSMF